MPTWPLSALKCLILEFRVPDWKACVGLQAGPPVEWITIFVTGVVRLGPPVTGSSRFTVTGEHIFVLLDCPCEARGG